MTETLFRYGSKSSKSMSSSIHKIVFPPTLSALSQNFLTFLRFYAFQHFFIPHTSFEKQRFVQGEKRTTQSIGTQCSWLEVGVSWLKKETHSKSAKLPWDHNIQPFLVFIFLSFRLLFFFPFRICSFRTCSNTPLITKKRTVWFIHRYICPAQISISKQLIPIDAWWYGHMPVPGFYLP